eukprot:2951209-Rhodomonas_salina.1
MVPSWLPRMAHGTVTTVYLGTQLGHLHALVTVISSLHLAPSSDPLGPRSPDGIATEEFLRRVHIQIPGEEEQACPFSSDLRNSMLFDIPALPVLDA